MTKRSLIITCLIGLTGAWLVWRQETLHEKAIKAYDEVAGRAEKLGVPILPESYDEASAPVKASWRRLEENRRTRAARRLAAEFLDFEVEMGNTLRSGGDYLIEMKLSEAEFADRMAGFSEAQVRAFLEELDASDVEEAARRQLRSDCMWRFCQSHPDVALDLLMESSETPDAYHVSAALRHLSNESPQAAMAWLRRHAESHPELTGDESERAVMSGAINADPKLAVDLVSEFGLDPGAVSYDFVFGMKTEEQRDAIWAAVRENGDQELEQKVLSDMTKLLVGSEFASARDWISEAGLDGEQTEVLINGLGRWPPGGETAEWMSWIGRQEGDHADGVRSLMNRWTQRDFRAAGKWLMEANEGQTRRVAVEAYAATVAPYDPEAAAQWVRELPEGKGRKDVARKVYAEWGKRDVAAALEFAEREGLDTD